MKIRYIIGLLISSLLLVACSESKPPPPPPPPAGPLPFSTPSTPKSLTDVNDFNATPNGSMTNESPADMQPADLSNYRDIPRKDLLGYVQQAIIPTYQDWVILKNGTYIIFDNIDTVPDIKASAIQMINHYKPKNVLDNNWDYSVTDLDKIEGWGVYGNGYGIYTLVLAKELTMGATPPQIAAYAKAKRAMDEENPQVIYVSSKHGVEEIKN